MMSCHWLDSSALSEKSIGKKPELVLNVKSNIEDNNYLYEAVGVSDKIVRWRKTSINIYIPKNSYHQTVKSAFDKWQSLAPDIIAFKETEAKSKADIRIEYKNIIEPHLGGLTKTYHQGNKLLKADIFLIDQNKKKEPLDKDIMYKLALHEIGHSLGIIGHSSNSNDIMSLSDVANLKGISTNDINTLKLIYSDKNGKLEEQNKILAMKISEQEEKVKLYPNNKFQLLMLADLYKNIKNYPVAIKTYEKVISIDKNCAQAYYSIGFCKYYLKNKTEALEYFKDAIVKEPDNEVFLHAYVKVACETNNKKEAEKILSEFIEKHPNSKNSPIITESLRKIRNK